MNLYDKSSLILVPSGVKASKVYSQRPENGSGDFTFTRASVANRINKDGLIEQVASNVPRLDYTNSSCPSLLLEPTRTNLIPYSELFSDVSWVKTGSSVVSGFLSPDGGLNAFKLVEGTNNGVHRLRKASLLTGSTKYTISVFAKAGERTWLNMSENQVGESWFDLGNGVTGTSSAEASGMVAFANGWYICWQTSTPTSTGNVDLYIASDGSNKIYQGDGTSGVYIWGAQAEAASYPTSYIPTYGTATTRSDDFNNQNDLISTPYVFDANDNFTFMYEGSFFDDGISNMICGGGSASLGSTGKSYWWLQTNSNRIRLYGDGELMMGSANYTYPTVNTNGKYLVRKADGVIDFFVNGTKLTTTQGTPNLRFDLRSAFWSYNPSAYTISGMAKQFLVFETALTDSECIALTTL